MKDESQQKGRFSSGSSSAEWRRVYIFMFVILPLTSLFFLYLEHVTHFEFLLHVAAIPLEILLGAFLVERFLARKERNAKLQQLMYIKSYIFRSEMRYVFIRNFQALVDPPITIDAIAKASLEELKTMRANAKNLKYRSPEDLEPVVDAYVRSRPVFQSFLEWAIANDFEAIFRDMIFLLHFIQDVRMIKEQGPDRRFMREAARQPELMSKLNIVLQDGVRKFLDYAIELMEKQPAVFEELMEDYQLYARMKKEETDGGDSGASKETAAGAFSPSNPMEPGFGTTSHLP